MSGIPRLWSAASASVFLIASASSACLAASAASAASSFLASVRLSIDAETKFLKYAS